jgi:hypothetical protein
MVNGGLFSQGSLNERMTSYPRKRAIQYSAGLNIMHGGDY